MPRLAISFALAAGVFGQTAIETDICVLAATPAGIAASIAASRAGSRVVVVERGSHIGGLPANGLGVTDITTRSTIGGIFKEFIAAVKQHYVNTYGVGSSQVRDSGDGYHFEPHVAEQVFEQMLSVATHVQVLREHQFDGQAETAGGKLRSILVTECRSGRAMRIRAKVFIDATYEGDLAAAAGVPFRIGREGREQTLEPYAGVFYSFFGTKQIYPDPRTGQADGRIQAYNYRLCLTDHEELRVLPEKPVDYRREDYASLVEDIHAGRVTAFGATPATTAGVFNIVRIPNGKSDTNNHHNSLVSTDLPEENQPWPEADWVWREKFSRRLRDYTLGLLWFTQNDPELPDWFRNEARRWGLAKDEYQDNANFPRQVYVREARRIAGEYDFSAHDAMVAPGARRTVIHPDTITAAHYPIDSHALRKREPEKLALDGFLALPHITRPYTVPYRVIVPRRVDGLLVPVAVSATHLGFGTLRMEPCWMAMGQAAGTAAHLAIESRREVRAVDIGRLQRALLESGQVLVHFRDVTGSELWFKALQFYGARLFFPGWDAEPRAPVLRGEAIAWFEKIGHKVWDRSRPFEALDWQALEQWLGRKLQEGEHSFVLRYELASVLYEAGL
ncbi:MAG TPA: FAD-dependent oxidoreductase [Bryobacteraceae bacterium]|nr:FAD-dependent oxidoreductase [Bryobacteraceae bacterium]